MDGEPRLSWCPDEPARCVYRGPIRDAKFGSRAPGEHAVWEIARFRLGFLHPFPRVDYTDDSYRTAVNDSACIEQYFRLHAAQQPGFLSLFRGHLREGMTVADSGCGGGALLDLVRAETRGPTIAIEPFTGYHDSLRGRGHEVHSTAGEALARGAEGRADVVLSLHVIEHVADPVEYLSELRRLAARGGLAVVLTPNRDDILLRADPARMEPFFYRRVHNYYFTAESLRWVAGLAGWSPVSDIFHHEFGIANALLWLRDGKPAGHARIPGLDEGLDASWRELMERRGLANNVGILLRNA